MERYLCIHGHFYQPPRENPWLEAVEVQDGAYPYHDWNERITAECYAPNATSRILDSKGLIKSITNNYSRISFNMGPTLLSWLQRQSPDVHQAIVDADKEGAKIRSGHGPALAQAYNHIIMPLATERDIKTQVEWGIADFMYRFGRDPEGMWLPETAVDIRTLEAMAEMGIKYTLLAPRQAARIRGNGSDWAETPGDSIDPKMPYLCLLPSGRRMALFFYDGAVSQAVAFEGLLKSGDTFAKRLMGGFRQENINHPQLMHIATDGESYGHHHRFGDMALSYALDHIEDKGLAQVTNYGEFLAKYPPQTEVEIIENTSWSCAHGVERWRSDCGCHTGGHGDWNQKWRTPLRDALDRLRDEAAESFESFGAKYFHNPTEARNAYIDVILDRSDESVNKFLDKHLINGDVPSATKISRTLGMLELQRNSMLMYTSCGWFFDDLSGIETMQILRYAGRVIQLAKKLMGVDMQEGFLSILENAKSNIPSLGNGADSYHRSVTPLVVSLSKVAAHYAISSMFDQYGKETDIFCYKVKSLDYKRYEAGSTELVIGHCEVSSTITHNAKQYCFALAQVNTHDFSVGVQQCDDPLLHRAMAKELSDVFMRGSFSELIRLMDKNFGGRHYSLGDMFTDEQRRVLKVLTRETRKDFEESYRRMYQDNYFLMNFIRETGVPVPKYYLSAADFTLSLDLKRLLKSTADAGAASALMTEMQKWGLTEDNERLEYWFKRTLNKEMDALSSEPANLERLVNISRLLDMATPFKMDLWSMQNKYYTLARDIYRKTRDEARRDNPEDRAWVASFEALGRRLFINLNAILSNTNPTA